MFLKRAIQIIALCVAAGIIYGFYAKYNIDPIQGDRIIGLSILATSFLLMPLFIYHRWKGKDIRNYMLTKENLEKMNEISGSDKKKSENH